MYLLQVLDIILVIVPWCTWKTWESQQKMIIKCLEQLRDWSLNPTSGMYPMIVCYELRCLRRHVWSGTLMMWHHCPHNKIKVIFPTTMLLQVDDVTVVTKACDKIGVMIAMKMIFKQLWWVTVDKAAKGVMSFRRSMSDVSGPNPASFTCWWLLSDQSSRMVQKCA